MNGLRFCIAAVVSIILSLGALSLSASPAKADDDIFRNNEFEPGELGDTHIDVSGSYEYGVEHADRMLIGVSFHGLHQDGRRGTYYRLFWVEGTVSKRLQPAPVGPDGNQNKDQLGVNVKITPFIYNRQIDFSPDTLFRIGIVPLGYERNVSLGAEITKFKAFRLDIPVSEPEGRSMEQHPQDTMFFFNFAIEAIGYTHLTLQKDGETIFDKKGFSIVNLAFAVGREWKLSAFDGHSSLRWTIFDFNFDAGFTHMDVGAYSQLAFLLRNARSRPELFARVGFRAISPNADVKDGLDTGDVNITTGFKMSW